MTRSFLCMCGYSCVCSLVQKLSSLAISSIQAPYKLAKLHTSFIFKLVSKLSKNQTCTQVVALYLGICGFCTRCIQVIEKSNLYASYTLSNNYYKFLAKLVNDWNALLVAEHYTCAYEQQAAANPTTPSPLPLNWPGHSVEADADCNRPPPLCSATLCPVLSTAYHMLFTVRNYTKFYSSMGHATNIGINVSQWGECARAKLSVSPNRVPWQVQQHQCQGPPAIVGRRRWPQHTRGVAPSV
jgi:hypothetical protein